MPTHQCRSDATAFAGVYRKRRLSQGEEIKVIEQQVLELETRITICRDRLQNLNEDKDRLAAMMSRYVGDGRNFSAANLGLD